MLHKRDWIYAAAAVLAVTGSMAPQAQAQTPVLSYAAKFVCGTRTSFDYSVVKGLYETSVNIHNPHFATVQFRKKAVIAWPQSSPPGPISNIVQEVLQSDQALGVNCPDIRRLFVPSAAGFIEGFLVLYVPDNTPFDVVEVHTARHSGTVTDGSRDVESIDTREVNPQRVIMP